MAFYFWNKRFGACKKKEKIPKKKKHYKFASFYAPQHVFFFLDQAIWCMQKSLKNDRKITQNHKLPSETTKYLQKKILKPTKKAPINSQEVSNMKKSTKNFNDTSCGSKDFSIFLQVRRIILIA
jgi:hypothetical protein